MAMQVAIQTYRQNRAEISANELKRYDGQWVAFSADGAHVVASADNIAQLSERIAAGHLNLSELVLEKIEFDSGESCLGGAELL